MIHKLILSDIVIIFSSIVLFVIQKDKDDDKLAYTILVIGRVALWLLPLLLLIGIFT